MNADADVIVIGAGAAGLMCAAQAAKRGLSVRLLEHSNKAGKKILMSGGGRCNFTNYVIESEHYLSHAMRDGRHNPHFCKSALSRFTQWDFIAMLEEKGIAYHEKLQHPMVTGQLFAGTQDDNGVSEKASAKYVANMLLDLCDEHGVDLHLNCTIESLEKLDLQHECPESQEQRLCYAVQTTHGKFQAGAVVVATGGLSIPTLGATGFAYEIAEQFGIDCHPRRAGLVAFYLPDALRTELETLSGVSVDVEVSCAGRSFRENMLFTHRGLSGPAILQISSYWQQGDSVSINLLPEFDVLEYLKSQQKTQPKQQLATALGRIGINGGNGQRKACLSKSVVKTLLTYFSKEHGFAVDKNLADYSHNALEAIAHSFHCWQIKPPNTEGYRTAEVTLGGISTDEVSSKTFETHKHEGLYFIGEALDVTGWLGGYNFQWAWSSAYCAAEALINR